MGNSSSSYSQSYVPIPPLVQNVGGPEDRYGSSTSSTTLGNGKGFKTKGMQLGSKGAKKQADLLESLGGNMGAEEDFRAPLLVCINCEIRLE